MKIPYRFLSLGDSYTIGTGAGPTENWPTQLKALLEGNGIPTSTPYILAKNGWTSKDLLNALDKTRFTKNFDVVFLLIGVNDQYDGVLLQTYKRNLQSLLRQAIEIANDTPQRVVVLSIPDWSVTPFAASFNRKQVATQIAHFNTCVHQEAKAFGCRYLNITPNSRRAATDPTLLASDELHPSGKMYADWAALLLPFIME